MASGSENQLKSAGYYELVARYNLSVLPHYCRSFIAPGSQQKLSSHNGVIEQIFRDRYDPGESLLSHLVFALKHEGVNVEILAALFHKVSAKDLAGEILEKPTSSYHRRIWFLYEFLMEKELPIPDLTQGNYVDVLDERKYYVASARKVARYRVRNNLLGPRTFCPLIRKTQLLEDFEAKDLSEAAKRLLKQYPPEILRRAVHYIYTKETKSSFEIEREQPTRERADRYVALLQQADRKDFMNKQDLVDLQKHTVDERFANDDYRKTQNFVGETVSLTSEIIHYVSPKPEDLEELMAGLCDAHSQMAESSLPPPVHAAIVSFGFVFLHPFDDGNGRIHRFLIHNILAQSGFTPARIAFPVSATILRNITQYDRLLESVSRPLQGLVQYRLDAQGEMTVRNDTARHYRFLDYTAFAEALYGWIESTIHEELPDELRFLVGYDQAKEQMQEIIDIPDRLIDLFIRAVVQNKGSLSKRKREKQFEKLTDDEIASLEECVQVAFDIS